MNDLSLFDVADARPLVHVDQRRERRDLAEHHVRLEPGRGVNWIAFMVDDRKIRDTGTGPYAALARLLNDAALDPRTIPDGPGNCGTCGKVNPCVADSPKGTRIVTFYCDWPCAPGADVPPPRKRLDR